MIYKGYNDIPMKGNNMPTPDAFEDQASELFDTQMARYVEDKIEASKFLSRPLEIETTEKIKQLCSQSKTAEYGMYEF